MLKLFFKLITKSKYPTNFILKKNFPVYTLKNPLFFVRIKDRTLQIQSKLNKFVNTINVNSLKDSKAFNLYVFFSVQNRSPYFENVEKHLHLITFIK